VAVTVDDVAEHLGFAVPPPDPDAVQRVLDSAHAVIDPHLIVEPVGVQLQVYDTCVLRVCSELWAWRSTPQGVVTFADGSTSVQPVLRDAWWPVEPVMIHAGLASAAVVA
jgi:hypothetical protein